MESLAHSEKKMNSKFSKSNLPGAHFFRAIVETGEVPKLVVSLPIRNHEGLQSSSAEDGGKRLVQRSFILFVILHHLFNISYGLA
jgi:hypothetical protein